MFKKVFLGGFCAFLLPASAILAEETTLLKQDFESQVPGQVPSGWGRAWGKQGEDLFRVTSDQAYSGKQSMLFDRLTGGTSSMWGLQKGLPSFKQGKATLSFKFRIDGPGNLANFSLEFRGKKANTDRLFSVAFKDRKISLRSYAKAEKSEQNASLGTYLGKQWYSLSLVVPATPADGSSLEAELVPLNNPEQKTTGRVAMRFPQKEFGLLMLCTAPGKAGYQVFFDDFLVSQATPETHAVKETEVKKVKALIAGAVLATAVTTNGDGVDQKLKNFMGKTKSQRVAVVAIGDSNQDFGGHGWTQYMSEAILNQFGAYGTGLVEVGGRVPSWAKAKGTVNSGAPADLAGELFSYWYLPAGETQKSNWNVTGFGLAKDHPMDLKGALKFRLQYAEFAEGAGSFRPAVRINQPPWKTIASAPASVSTSGEKTAMKQTEFVLQADPARTTPLMFSVSAVNAMITGPFLGEFCSVENTDKQTGCSYQKLYGAGGHSLHEMLTNLRKKGDKALASYFSFVRGSLNGDKSCLVMINSGLNDRNRKILSSGPEKKAMANTPAGYSDNLKGLVLLLQKAWTDAGGTQDTLHIAFMPSHPISTPDDAKLVSYRIAANELAAQSAQTSCILLPEIVPQSVMQSQGYYDKRGHAHLDRKGYQAISTAVAKQMAE
jgi:hypothetical protein